MPELPEVETTLRGIQPYLQDATITDIRVRNPSLRWPVPVRPLQKLCDEKISACERRAKYILIHTDRGTIMLHLGMSGSLRVLSVDQPAGKHDHLDIELNQQHILRLNDPRRFGCCLLLKPPVAEHKLLANLGPEPLTDAFNGDILFRRSRGRRVAVKNLIMDGQVVVGVGNIYASEALFLAGVRPTLTAGRLSRARYQRLAECIKLVLANAIKAGGTTLNDFTQADGSPGYFKQELFVYGRAGEGCLRCSTTIKAKTIGQRSSFYCPACQSF
ncbi:MAG: bifunctional DNA-formamidopyrimidine glycosylase/DNA-(apurinic or apyrimidinic site) lyase [Pseudomonadota bacterium]